MTPEYAAALYEDFKRYKRHGKSTPVALQMVLDAAYRAGTAFAVQQAPREPEMLSDATIAQILTVRQDDVAFLQEVDRFVQQRSTESEKRPSRLTKPQRVMLLLAAEDTRGFMYRWADTWRTGEALCARGLMQQGRNRAYEPGFFLTEAGRELALSILKED